ncbi:unnamed protein product [Nezara viridula]|uniref:Uncharacterized protein n=1 Tax=Nezara viridula TaxID=85310 RepID=A0A9P0HIM1_NEZVI|nr:unnamed protein product [Nezara viridula]
MERTRWRRRGPLMKRTPTVPLPPGLLPSIEAFRRGFQKVCYELNAPSHPNLRAFMEREKEEWSNNSSPKPPQFAPSGPKRYLQCPAGFKMLHLKKFLRLKYGLSANCNPHDKNYNRPPS